MRHDTTTDPASPAWPAQRLAPGRWTLLKITGEIDLAIPVVEAAIEAAVALGTSLGATPVSAGTWLGDFKERTMRIRAMRNLTRSVNKKAETATPTRSIRP